jgi:hypothetical protein
LAQAFRTGQVNFQDPALQADLNRWVSGKHTPGMSKYVSGVASAYGANVPPTVGFVGTTGGGAQRPVAPPIPSPPHRPVFNPMAYAKQVLGQPRFGRGIDFPSFRV